MARPKVLPLYVSAFIVWIIVFILSLTLGAVSGASMDLVTELRLPRVLLASMIGLGLSVSGAVLQAVFSNPLCEPYTLGISSGSALGAVIGVSLGLEWMVSGLAGSAFIGALLFTGVLFTVAKRSERNQTALLLTGVMLSFLGSSLVALWVALTDSNGLPSAILWLFGDLSRARLSGALVLGPSVLLISASVWKNWRQMDALLMGEEGAASLGVDVPSFRRNMILLTSVLIGLCVSAGGMIGFIGLVVPHFVRRLTGSLHLHMIPLCGIWGGSVLMLADCVSRTAIRPYELPVGIVTALIGAPAFLWIMLRKPEFV